MSINGFHGKSAANRRGFAALTAAVSLSALVATV